MVAPSGAYGIVGASPGVALPPLRCAETFCAALLVSRLIVLWCGVLWLPLLPPDPCALHVAMGFDVYSGVQ